MMGVQHGQCKSFSLVGGRKKAPPTASLALGDGMIQRAVRKDVTMAARPLVPGRVRCTVVVVALALLAVCTSACQMLDPQPPATTPAPSTPVGPVSPPQQMVVCVDKSTSYRFTQMALDAVAGLIPQLVRPGGGWTTRGRRSAG